MLKDKKMIKQWLDKHQVKNYTINENLTIDVNGHVNISDNELKEIPVQFNVVKGDFCCIYSQLTSLKGSPLSISGNFECSHNLLTSLEGAPAHINSFFNCSFNKLENLEFCPQTIHGYFDFYQNDVNTMQWFPQSVGAAIYASNNAQLGELQHLTEFESFHKAHSSFLLSKSLEKELNYKIPPQPMKIKI